MSSNALPLDIWLNVLDFLAYETIVELSNLIQIPRPYQWLRLKQQMETKLQVIPRPIESHPSHIMIYLDPMYILEYTAHENDPANIVFLLAKTPCCQERSELQRWKLDRSENTWFVTGQRFCQCWWQIN